MLYKLRPTTNFLVGGLRTEREAVKRLWSIAPGSGQSGQSGQETCPSTGSGRVHGLSEKTSSSWCPGPMSSCARHVGAAGTDALGALRSHAERGSWVVLRMEHEEAGKMGRKGGRRMRF